MILHENAAYLVDDDRRDETFESLRRQIGLRAKDLLKAAPREIAAAIASGGMQPERRAQKLIDAAEILATEFRGSLAPVLAFPEPVARKALKLFPGVGDPLADRIFLYSRTRRVFAMDSNALRVVIRLGYGSESSSYAKTYRSAQGAAHAELPRRFDAIIEAGQLLRIHGQKLCRRSNPACRSCPLRNWCAFALAQGKPEAP